MFCIHNGEKASYRFFFFFFCQEHTEACWSLHTSAPSWTASQGVSIINSRKGIAFQHISAVQRWTKSFILGYSGTLRDRSVLRWEGQWSFKAEISDVHKGLPFSPTKHSQYMLGAAWSTLPRHNRALHSCPNSKRPLLRETRPFQGRELSQRKTLDYRAVPRVCSIFPNFGKHKQVFCFQFQHGSVLIVAGRAEQKTAFTWGTAAESNNLGNTEE